MMKAAFLAGVLLFGGKGIGDPALVGKWGAGGQTVLVLDADGTGSIAGTPFTWTAADHVIHVTASDGEKDQMSYQIADGQLAVVAGGVPMALTKMGKGAAA